MSRFEADGPVSHEHDVDPPAVPTSSRMPSIVSFVRGTWNSGETSAATGSAINVSSRWNTRTVRAWRPGGVIRRASRKVRPYSG